MGAAVTSVSTLGNGAKVAAMSTGGALGIGTGVAADHLLPSPDAERRLEKKGVSTISHREATATFAPMAFVAAAAVGTGIGKRSSTAAITTASLGAAAMLASTGASAMINADGESADEYLRTLGLMTGVAAGGFAIGAMDEVPLNKAKLIGLGLVGLACGALIPETYNYLSRLPEDFQRSVKHRDD